MPNRLEDYTYCFYSLEHRRIIDLIDENDRTISFGLTLEEVKEEFPDAAKAEFEQADKLIEKSIVTEPTKINSETFYLMRDAMPCVDHTFVENQESFKMSERTYGKITRIYCRIAEDYYFFADYITISHQEIITKVLNSLRN